MGKSAAPPIAQESVCSCQAHWRPPASPSRMGLSSRSTHRRNLCGVPLLRLRVWRPGYCGLGLLRLGNDRGAVHELDPVHVPGAAGCAAAQRLDGEAQLVAGLERLAVPAVAGERARAAAFQIPRLGIAVLVLDVEDDEGVRARIFELPDHPGDFLRVLL